MEINKEINLKKLPTCKEGVYLTFLRWSFGDYEFEYVDGDSRFDVKYPNGKWFTKPVYGKHNKAGAITTIKQFLTLELLKDSE